MLTGATSVGGEACLRNFVCPLRPVERGPLSLVATENMRTRLAGDFSETARFARITVLRSCVAPV